jgi:nitrile hydratase beta subunit
VNGIHDMGGLQCFGAIVKEANEPVFHNDWERRTFAMTLAMGASGKWNIDTLRSVRESLPPITYLSIMATCEFYYQIWLDALEQLLVQTDLVTQHELQEGKASSPPIAMKALTAESVGPIFSKGWPSERIVDGEPRFSVGDEVRTRMLNTPTHTRLPGYCRDKPGTIVRIHGAHVLPDSNAECRGENPEWLYTVKFNSKDLWGDDTTASFVHVDCWESYLANE